MSTVIGIAGLVAIIVGAFGIRRALRDARDGERALRDTRTAARPARPVARSARRTVRPARPTRFEVSHGDDVGGWLVGHQIAQGQRGFPGDPLPGGHLGSAADLAFWGGIFDDDEDD